MSTSEIEYSIISIFMQAVEYSTKSILREYYHMHLPKDILVSSGKWTFINIQEKIEVEQNFLKVLQLQETCIQQISLKEMKENILFVL